MQQDDINPGYSQLPMLCVYRTTAANEPVYRTRQLLLRHVTLNNILNNYKQKEREIYILCHT